MFRLPIVSFGSSCQNDVRIGGTIPRCILRAMMDSSGAHSRQAEDPVEARGDKWLLFQWEVRFDALPEEGASCVAETAATGIDRLYALREFVLRDEATVYARARTRWVLVDGQTGRPMRVPPFFADVYGIDEPTWQESTADEPPKELEGSSRRFVAKEEHIDGNDHVNNLVYVDWLFQSIPEEDVRGKTLKKLTLTYRKQVLCGDETEFVSQWETPTRCLHRLRDVPSGAVRSWAVTEWEDEEGHG